MRTLVDATSSPGELACALLALAGAVAAGCAADGSSRFSGASPALTIEPVIAQPLTATAKERETVARNFSTARDCVLAAAATHASERDAGWALLKACTTRADFRDLELLLGEPWTAELRRRKDAGTLIARVVAARGGNVDRDLRECRRHALPLYSVRAALAEPDVLAGRYVLMRGSAVGWRRADVDGRAVELAETRPVVDEDFFDDEELHRRRTRNVATFRDELSVETGITLFAALPSGTVLEPSADYVLLLRFDGERDAIVGSRTTVVRAAVATVIDAFEPESNLVAWR